MQSKIVQTGSNYQLYIANPESDPKRRIQIGIRLKEGTFDPATNFVAVLIEKDMLKTIIEDLQARLEEV